MIGAAEELGQEIGIARACRELGVARSSLYRARQPRAEPAPRPTPARALSAAEKAEVREVLNSDEFANCTPRQVYATLLDAEGVYLCHWRTMYRLLAAAGATPQRRQRRRIRQAKPELRATGPNQVWSWDITQLKGADGIYYLYTVIDVYSRYIVGWLIALHERGELAEQLIAETCDKESIAPQQLTLHADHGSPMRAKTLKELLKELEITESHSRPYTPTDNPFSEAEFKTLKYRPDYPERFATLKAARQWLRRFVHWYNHVHYHSGLALQTPVTVHLEETQPVVAQRQRVMNRAYAAHPERFVAGAPTAAHPPAEVWLNQPRPEQDTPTPFSGAVTTDSEPGAQAESRAKSAASLDAAEHLATIGGSLPRRHNEPATSLPLLGAELSQSH
jgi:putative transposase